MCSPFLMDAKVVRIKRTFKCRSTTFITALRTILSSRETDCTVLTFGPSSTVISRYPPSLNRPLLIRFLILSTAFGTSASILRPAKLRFRLLLRNTVFMASSILESSTISSIILSSLHMIIKSAFNSPGRASSKKSSYQTPLPCALFFPFPAVNGCCWRGSFLLLHAGTRPHCCTPIFKAYALFLYSNCLQGEHRCSRSCSMNRYSRSHTKHRPTRSRCCSTDTPHECI